MSIHPEMCLFMQLQCLHHSAATFVSLYANILSLQPHIGDNFGRRVISSLWDKKLQRHFSHYSSLTKLWNESKIAGRYGFLVSRYGHSWFYERIFRIFVMTRWIAFHTVLCLYCCAVDNKTYWLMGTSLINPWGMHKPMFFVVGMCELTKYNY